MINADKSSDVPLYRQVYESVRRDILDGVWKPGEKIPSIRNLMSDLGVSRNTIVNACQQLAAEGYIQSRHGAGYFVSDISFDVLRKPNGSRDAAHRLEEPKPPEKPDWICDFSYGNLRPGSFPANVWRKLVSEALAQRHDAELSSYNAHLGEPGLRYEIARYLERSRGVSCSVDQVIVTSGVQQSMERLLTLFDSAHDGFAMENPGFQGVRMVARDLNFKIFPFASDAPDSVWLDQLAKAPFKVAYVTPSNQMPMGTYQSLEARTRLLELAMEKDAYLVEDDYDSVYRFNALPIATLQSLDKWDRVVYLGTFSKTLSPMLRIGYMVLPPKLLARYVAHFERYRCTVSWLDQETLRQFMKDGHLERHVRRIELDTRERHAVLVQELLDVMPDEVEIVGRESGLHLMLRVRNGMDQEKLVASAAKAGVCIMDTRRYWSDPAQAPDNLVMLGYSSASRDEMLRGVRLLKQAWFS